MQFVIAFACLLAVASAGHIAAPLAYAHHGTPAVAYNAPLVSAPHPVEVHHAYAHHGTPAVAYNAPLVSAPHPVPVHHAYAHHAVAVAPAVAVVPRSFGYQTTSVHPVGYAYAGPYAHEYAHVEPIAHAYAHAAPIAHAYAHAAPIAHAAVPLATEARLVDPIAIAAGAPLPTGDTVEVAAAKAAHFEAHAAAKGLRYKRSPVFAPLAYAAPIHSYGYSTYTAHHAPLAYAGYGHHVVSPYYG